MPNTLSVQDLTCEKGEQLLFSNINFTLNEGEILQIRGVNGSGKTSLLRILAGLAFCNNGLILWNNMPIQTIREQFAAQINYIGHKLGLKDDLTAYENLAYYCHFRKKHTLINHALTTLGIIDKGLLPLRQLSAGQKRRAALAKLVLLPAKLWILDEPFTAIDKEGVNFVVSLMETQQQQGGMVIFTSHQDTPLTHNKKELQLSC